jgi:hypothetical protein
VPLWRRSDATYGVAEVNHETGAVPMFMPSVG